MGCVSGRVRGCIRGLASVLFICALQFAPDWTEAREAVTDGNRPGAAQPPSSAALRTRFVVALDRKAEFQVSALQNPNRVVVDLPDVKVQLPPLPKSGPIGLVSGFRSGLAAPGRMRVVIDVTQPVIVERSALVAGKDGAPTQLTIEILPAAASLIDDGSQRADGSRKLRVQPVAVQPPLPKRAERPEARAARSFKPVIVLDPGHGGTDSGAMENGTVEKEVVLAFGLMLRQKLNATGRYKVLMTRDTDTFVPLQERREFAETNKAALFIAIHADYASSSASGATVYSLRESVAEDLKHSAQDEVAEDVLSDKEVRSMRAVDTGDNRAVRSILTDLARREVSVTRERSSVFARSVIQFMGASTSMMSNPDRTAAFAVLRTAKVPAVLIELAYVSNRQDAARLRSTDWRRKVSDSIVTAIENYFSHNLARLPL